MKKPTFEQFKKLNELYDSLKAKNNSEKRATFTSILQILKEIDSYSEFTSSISFKLSLLNSDKDSEEKIEDIENLIKQAIEHY